MIKESTDRGFTILNFEDLNGNACSIQESSVATEDCIWLGIDDPNPRIMTNNEIVKYHFPEEVHITSRMHLNKEKAKDLVKVLNKFIETGEL